MINFNGTYFKSSDIEVVRTYKSEDDYPYGLAVTLKSGRTYYVKYKHEKARNDEIYIIVHAVDMQERGLTNDIAVLRMILDQIESRQKRIQKALNRFLKSKELEE